MEALIAATPNWDQLSKQEQRKLWKEHLDVLYPDIKTEPVYACLTCHDIKFLYPTKNGKPDYSDHIPCPECAGWTTEDRTRFLEIAGIPPARQKETLANFHYVEGAADAFEAASMLGYGSYEDENNKKHETPWKFLLVYGIHGSGKTHLGRGALIAAADRSVKGRYVTVRQLMAQLREAMDSKVSTHSPDTIIKSLKEVPFLVLDELGTEDPKSDWQAGVLEDIINHRYDNLMPTFLITNRDIKELPPAITSRLSDESICRTVWNQAPDYRLRKS